MATSFLDLQNGFYNALSQGLGFAPGSPFQMIQPSPPIASGSQANALLWNYFNNIPPLSLTQNAIQSGGNQFFSDYSGLMSALQGASNTFESDIGEKAYTAWNAYQANLPFTTPVSQLPLIFRNWAITHGFSSVATKGASDLAAMLLDPITNAQLGLMNYVPNGANAPDWVPGYDVLVQQLGTAPLRQFSVSSSSMNSNVSKSWSGGSNSGFFGLWGGSSSSSSQSAQFASSDVTVNATFGHVFPFSPTPGNWYNSGALGLAYSTQSGAPWNPSSPINWQNTFGPNGNMQRFATQLIVVSGMYIEVSSSATFSQSDQQQIQSGSGAGLWPFYSQSSSSGSSTSVSFNAAGNMTVTIASDATTPIAIGVNVIGIAQFVGHSVEGAKIFAKAKGR